MVRLSNDLADKRRQLTAKQVEMQNLPNRGAVDSPLRAGETERKVRRAERDLATTQREIDAALREAR